jgi:hypothetical protein
MSIANFLTGCQELIVQSVDFARLIGRDILLVKGSQLMLGWLVVVTIANRPWPFVKCPGFLVAVFALRKFRMAKLGICAAFLAGAALFGAADARAADAVPTKASPSTTNSSAPRACTDPADFFTTNCQLIWRGITIFGIVDTGVSSQCL